MRESPVRRNALVLCGGASRGALEVGLYRALHDLGVRVDLVVGSSIGALNGAFVAAGAPAEELAHLWLEFRRADAVSLNLAALLRLRRGRGVFTLDPLRALLRRKLPARRFEDLALPLTIVTTDLQEGGPVYWTGTGDLIEPLVASLSLPVFFPPVEIGGHQHVDGSLADNFPIGRALALGATDVYLIQCGSCERTSEAYRGLLGVLARSLTILVDRSHAAAVAPALGRARIHVVRPGTVRDRGLLDFSLTRQWIEAGYRMAIEQLRSAAGGGPGAIASEVVAGCVSSIERPVRGG